ncbi:gliding motility-associated C-terminal domain-containing protein, partial [Flavobacterium sp. T-16]
ITISGTPTASGTFSYSIPLTGGCGTVNATGTITVTPANTAGTLSGTQAVCVGSSTTFSATTTGGNYTSSATAVATVDPSTGVITGVDPGTATITYTVTGTGGCADATATRTVTVTPLNTIATGTNQTVCINSAITNITLATTGATGANFAGLPAGVTGSWDSNVVTISGTPTGPGAFNYTVTTTGGCTPETTSGTITVYAPTVTLTGTTSIAENSGSSTILTATLSTTTISDVTISISYSGTAISSSDYTANSTIITIPSGSTTGTVTITPIDDNINEGSETVIANIDSVTGGCATELGSQFATVTITDDDALPTVATITPASATEGSNVVFSFTLSNPSDQATTYTFVLTNGTAGSADYITTNVEVRVPAGATTGTVSVPTTVDTIDENDEDFTIAVGTISATGTILDNNNALIVAVDDNIGLVNGITGGEIGINVINNDTLNGILLSPTDVVITYIPNGPITVSSDGKIRVSPNTPAGQYTVLYTICEAKNPSNCSIGTVRVTVESANIILADDMYTNLSCNTAGIIGNILTNDTLNNSPIVPETINLTILSGQNANITLDNLGNLSIINNLALGQYDLTYQVCDRINPLNCKTAKITLVIKDNVSPIIIQLPATSTVSCGTTLNFAQAVATDNCGAVSLSFIDTTTTGNCAGSYTVTRTWTVIDTAGNTTTASQIINVQDNQGPVTATVFQRNINVNCDAIPVKPELIFTDNCSSVTSNNYTETINNNSSNSYTIIREWLVADTCGNTSRFTQNVNVTNTNGLQTIESSACNGDTGIINMNNLLPSGTPINGTWTDIDNTGALQGNQFNPFGQSIGDKVFEYKVSNTTCPTTVRITIKVNDDCLVLACGTVEVFNAISANNDSLNNKLVIKNIDNTSCYPENNLEIYNRWGVLVFETKNYNNQNNYFDGYSRGRTTIKDTAGLPTGTYYYILNYTAIDKDGNTQIKKLASYLYINR